VTLRQEYGLTVSENRMVRRIFGPERDEVIGGWRKLHNLYSSPSIIRMIKSRRMRWAVHVARIGAKLNAYRVLVGKPEGRRPLGQHRCRWVDNIKMDLTDIRWSGMVWIDLPQERDQWRALMNMVMNLRVPQNVEKSLSNCTPVGFSRRAQLHGVNYT
jgi:hypothetical protein